VLTEQDKQELSQNYPTINCSLPRNIMWGTLEFFCSYDEATKEIVHDNSFNNYIHDSYEIRIDFNQTDTFGFPKVFEDSEIINNFANDHEIELKDLHINKDEADSCCLGIFPEYRWHGASAFIRDKVTPFFYWQSHRRIYRKEPWKGYAHGNPGIEEAMTMPPTQSSKGRSRNKPCPCGSSRKYKKCCMQRDAILKSKLSKYSTAQKN
jgi:hypothetical protein